MGRNSLFVNLGSLWTLTSVLLLFQMALPIDVTLQAGLSLAVCTTVSALLFFLAVDLGSEMIRAVAFVAHLSFPMFWAGMVAASMGLPVEAGTAGVLALCSLIGAGMSDLGVYLEREKMAADRHYQDMVAALTCSSNSYDETPSLGWRMRPLAACDSGSFPSL